ncbi:MAG: DUF5979 domain-containing protein, partial [Ilumatobacteraceae bacterium]
PDDTTPDDTTVDTTAPANETTTTTSPVVDNISDPTGTISIDKTNSAGGETEGDRGIVEPGDSFDWQIQVTCSSIEEDCVDVLVVDTFPAGLVVDPSTIPGDIPGFRDVTWDGTTLSIRYTKPLSNPVGNGLEAGGGDTFNVKVTLPANTTLETGDLITNEATMSASNVVESVTDPSTVQVNIPRVVAVQTTKSFTDGSAIAGDANATTTIQLTGVNQSSASTEVTQMVIEDSTSATWQYLDVTGVTVTQYPAGADQAALFVCPASVAPCTEAEWVAGGTALPPAPSSLTFPLGVPASDVVGVRVVFTAPVDGSIAPVAGGGTAKVSIDADLRTTVRSTGVEIATIPNTTNINNCATTSATDPAALPPSATSTPGCAPYQILPPTLSLVPSKSFFADANGNYQTNTGEHAVIGENSGVSMVMNARNTSAFPIAEIVITEPVAPHEFDKVDAASFRLTFPTGAVNARVVVTFRDNSSTTTDYAPPGPLTVTLPSAGPRAASITVTYTGDPSVDAGATIAPNATAGLGVHGNLNDLVDESDIGSGSGTAGVDNCAGFTGAGGGIPGSTGAFAGTACDDVGIEARNASTGGSKDASQTEISVGQPIVFRMRTSNNGNLPLFNLVVSDPPVGPGGIPPLTTMFELGEFRSAGIRPAAMAGRVTIEVYTPADGWRALGAVPVGDYPDVIGVRASIGVLAPTETFDFWVEMVLNELPGPDDLPLGNCYGITASGDDYEAESHCSPPLDPGPVMESAVINKAITPDTMPRRIPGLVPQNAAVSLRIQNTGNLTAKTLQLTDVDTDFWDAVDFVSLGSITPPADIELDRANRIQVDAFVNGAWVLGNRVAISSAALPAGVTAAQVRGLRFTFSDTSTLNDGFVLTPCPGTNPAAPCAGVVNFNVVPRLSLRSSGEPLPEELLDTATGAFTTQLHPDPANPSLIGPVTDNLLFVAGDPKIDVNKTPEVTTVAPGQYGTFNLTTTNNGTANLPDVTVSDPLPAGLLFDPTFAGDGGQPYTVTWSNLPPGYPAPPDPVFEMTADILQPDRVGLVRWTFPGWNMPPNSSVTILYRYSLEPGVLAGQVIVNTMGASSPVDDLACTSPDGQVTDGAFGSGLYCTDPAQVTVTSGANFASRKWVAGNPALGWYNVRTAQLVPVGGAGCLSLNANGRTYTTNPCIALVNPGEQFHYVLRVQNAGTESALRMTIIDTLPAPGDKGVLGANRGTQWSTAPTLLGPATYSGPASAQIGYTSSSSPCIADLYLGGVPCAPGAWADPPGATTTALRVAATFDPAPLPPGGTVDVYFSMVAPVDVPRVADPTIAWNSLAHAEVTRVGASGSRVLPPLEPLKVGVATMYGNLRVVKEIGENPGDLALDDLAFTFRYECVLSTGAGSRTGNVTATPTTPGVVTGIPAGSTCQVWETISNGGISSAPSDDPVVVEIEPSLSATNPVVAIVTVTNDFPFGGIVVSKRVTGGAQDEFTGGPYAATVDCTFGGTSLSGFPIDIELVPGETVPLSAPVGSVCTVVETDLAGADSVSYDPPSGSVVVPSDGDRTGSIEVTNDFVVGSLVIRKTVSGPGAPAFSAGPFEFDVTCDFNGNDDVYSTTVVVQGSADGAPVDSAPVTGLPVGASCTITETDSGGADEVAEPVTVTIEANDQANLAVAEVANYFSAGTIAVDKVVTGTAAADLPARDYAIEVTCAVERDGERVVVLQQEISVRSDSGSVV